MVAPGALIDGQARLFNIDDLFNIGNILKIGQDWLSSAITKTQNNERRLQGAKEWI